MNEIKLHKGDCLVENEKIKGGSVDLILTDLPYGTMKGITMRGMKNKCNWDTIIDIDKIMIICNRILRKNGKMILFAQDPFTTKLINKSIPQLPFLYRAIWVKDNFANCLNSKKAMLNYFEDILIFSKTNEKHDLKKLHPLRKYFLEQKRLAKLTNKKIKILIGSRMGEHYFTLGGQFYIPTFENYKKLQTTGFFKEDWQKIKDIDSIFREKLKEEVNSKYPSTFNIWDGKKHKSNVLNYKKDYTCHHPTQKPVALLQDLIKTFSNENDLVVDLTMGSGSTGVACKKTKRNFIGIEKDAKYFKIAKDRLNFQTLF